MAAAPAPSPVWGHAERGIAAGAGVVAAVALLVAVVVGGRVTGRRLGDVMARAAVLGAALYGGAWALGAPGGGWGTCALTAFLVATTAVPLAADARVGCLSDATRIALFPSAWVPARGGMGVLPACAAAVGAVAGASALPLDWGDAWLQYPLPCLAGGVCGWCVGAVGTAGSAGVQWMRSVRRAHG